MQYTWELRMFLVATTVQGFRKCWKVKKYKEYVLASCLRRAGCCRCVMAQSLLHVQSRVLLFYRHLRLSDVSASGRWPLVTGPFKRSGTSGFPALRDRWPGRTRLLEWPIGGESFGGVDAPQRLR
uniref:Uncharacterized protein n=1 Tax=Glossina pallidipes TaxID=7398 RepID=A0A1A9Z284_GLOPL